MAVTFEIVVVEKLASFSLFLAYPLGRLPVDRTNILLGLTRSTSGDE
jgi:hypothetical protein